MKRNRESVLALRQEVLISLVRLLRRAEAGELPHRPELAAITGGMKSARVGELPRKCEIAIEIEIGHMRGRGQWIDLHSADGREVFFPGCLPARDWIVNVPTPSIDPVPHCRQRLFGKQRK